MKYNKTIKFSILLVFLLLAGKFSTAQGRIYDTTTTDRLTDIMGIQSSLFTTPYLSFDATYYLTDIDSVTVRDTLTAKYKINGDSMYLVMLKDTVESVQNGNYFASIYHTNKSIVVQKPMSLSKQVLQVDVMDTVFQNMAMASMSYQDSSCDRSVTIAFDSNALYKNFTLHYCKLTNRPSYITYSVKKDISSSCNKFINMYVAFSNYQTGTFTSSVFSTDPFFTVRSSADIQLAAGMDPAYDVVNFLDQ
jgi:hypothetical protein